MRAWSIRDERPDDEPVIAALTDAAFRTSEHRSGDEARIVERLRDEGDLTLSLVAENMDQAIIGHVAFSPVTISDGSPGWYGLGPISVIPLTQRTGIGSALIREGLVRLRYAGAGGCTVLGDPAYYLRFGFTHDPALVFPGVPAKYFQRLVLAGAAPTGTVRYAPAFG